MVDVAQYYRTLSTLATDIVDKSTTDDFLTGLGEAHSGISELVDWTTALSPNFETRALKYAVREYQYALLFVVQGMYRAAYVSLRLCLEQGLAQIQFTANDLEFREWEMGIRDVSWSKLSNAENGVVSKRYATAYFPELEDSCIEFATKARALYRTCSEYVHGNVSTEPDSSGLHFNKIDYQKILLKICPDLLQTINFFLVMRFAKELKSGTLTNLEHILIDRLGHLPAIRNYLEIAAQGTSNG